MSKRFHNMNGDQQRAEMLRRLAVMTKCIRDMRPREAKRLLAAALLINDDTVEAKELLP